MPPNYDNKNEKDRAIREKETDCWKTTCNFTKLDVYYLNVFIDLLVYHCKTEDNRVAGTIKKSKYYFYAR